MQESVIYQSIQREAEKRAEARKQREIATNSLREGLPIEVVARVTGLSIEEVQQLLYASVLEEPAISDLFAKAIPSFSDMDYGHDEWFFGQSDQIPLYAGYTLGFELVSRYIRKQGKKASRLYDEPAEHFRSLA